MNAAQANPGIYLTLEGGKRVKLVLTLESICEAEKKLGKSFFKAINWTDLGANDIAVCLWAAMFSEDRTVTLEQVKKMFSLQTLLANLEPLKELLALVFGEALPTEDPTKEKKRAKKKPRK